MLGDPRGVPNSRIPVWDVGEVRLAMRVRHSRCGSDVADAAHGELVGTSGQAPVASSSSTAATTYSVLQTARRWSRSGGNFFLSLAAETKKSEKIEKRDLDREYCTSHSRHARSRVRDSSIRYLAN